MKEEGRETSILNWHSPAGGMAYIKTQLRLSIMNKPIQNLILLFFTDYHFRFLARIICPSPSTPLQESRKRENKIMKQRKKKRNDITRDSPCQYCHEVSVRFLPLFLPLTHKVHTLISHSYSVSVLQSELRVWAMSA